jgi:two-component system response regulator
MRTVLLVEDNPTDAFVIQEVVEKSELNLRLRIAEDGKDVLLYLEELCGAEPSSWPALVLLDLNLPKISGIEVLRRLREGPSCNRTPVIVVTSSTEESDRAAVQGLGAEAFFQKPRDLTTYMQLGQLIKRVLAHN